MRMGALITNHCFHPMQFEWLSKDQKEKISFQMLKASPEPEHNTCLSLAALQHR